MYRQGDIPLLPVPDEAVRDLPPAPRDGRGHMVLALGEATGHAHAMSAPGSLLRAPTPSSRTICICPPAGGWSMRSTRRSPCRVAGTG